MGFFDLNIPYDEHSSAPSCRTARIKIVTKIMELGYSGVAYNRTIRGVMSDQDRCSISLLTLSSLLKVVPSFSSSVEFHRDLLGVPRSSPFRQYTRLTICLNSHSEVLAVNSGNLILKTYDLVSVKPLNQHAFDQACEKLEIDIIAIDFAERLPFRLKQSMVKSAIRRGVYFEITYSPLISDVYERRQAISAAKMLVDWTRGKNLIFSSAASSVNEIRGPYDVANLSSLLGLSMERAKAAISKNCRALIANALRRKQFYKETIKVERISSNDTFDPKEPWSVDLFKWDPISSGEGDLLLDDMAKSFATSCEESKIVKAIDFTSVIDNMPPHGFQVKDVITGSEANLPLNNNRDFFHTTDVIEPPIAENGVIQQPHLSHEEHCPKSDRQCSVSESFEILNSSGDAGKVSSNTEEVMTIVEEIAQLKTSTQEEPIEMDMDGVQSQNLLSSRKSFKHCPKSDRQCSVSESFEILNSPSDAGKVSSNTEEVKTTVEEIGQPKTSTQEEPIETDMDDVQSQNLSSSSGLNVLMTNEIVCSTKSTGDVLAVCNNEGKEKSFKMSEDVDSSQNEYVLKSSDVFSGSENMSRDKSLTNLISVNQENMFLARDDKSMAEKYLLGARFRDPGDVAVPEDQLSLLRSCPMSSLKGDFLISIRQQTSDLPMEEQKRGEADTQIRRPPLDQSISGVMPKGKYRSKRSRHHPALLLPFKRLINPLAFKKVRKTKCHQ